MFSRDRWDGVQNSHKSRRTYGCGCTFRVGVPFASQLPFVPAWYLGTLRAPDPGPVRDREREVTSASREPFVGTYGSRAGSLDSAESQARPQPTRHWKWQYFCNGHDCGWWTVADSFAFRSHESKDQICQNCWEVGFRFKADRKTDVHG